MKEKDARVEFEQEQTVYVERDDGTYGPITTGCFLSKHYLDDYFDKKQDLERLNRQRLLNNEISPVAYHLERLGMTPADLAGRVGLSTRAVKKHMEIAHFGKVKLADARRYAEVFGVPLAGLFAVSGGDDPALESWEQSENPFVIKMLSDSTDEE